jgi:hypothetical protein
MESIPRMSSANAVVIINGQVCFTFPRIFPLFTPSIQVSDFRGFYGLFVNICRRGLEDNFKWLAAPLLFQVKIARPSRSENAG